MVSCGAEFNWNLLENKTLHCRCSTNILLWNFKLVYNFIWFINKFSADKNQTYLNLKGITGWLLLRLNLKYAWFQFNLLEIILLKEGSNSQMMHESPSKCDQFSIFNLRFSTFPEDLTISNSNHFIDTKCKTKWRP